MSWVPKKSLASEFKDILKNPRNDFIFKVSLLSIPVFFLLGLVTKGFSYSINSLQTLGIIAIIESSSIFAFLPTFSIIALIAAVILYPEIKRKYGTKLAGTCAIMMGIFPLVGIYFKLTSILAIGLIVIVFCEILLTMTLIDNVAILPPARSTTLRLGFAWFGFAVGKSFSILILKKIVASLTEYSNVTLLELFITFMVIALISIVFGGILLVIGRITKC
ncbi:hypothetical protein [Xylocopilactobacillus apicola]|uniref:hypothetical protein n=1 Tax=Xylocopilactobacillus apicola TaxID=2932184 RepID=UPI00295435A2|nr:hypothetical protein [Xylocopilactobacillus apicola]